MLNYKYLTNNIIYFLIPLIYIFGCSSVHESQANISKSNSNNCDTVLYEIPNELNIIEIFDINPVFIEVEQNYGNENIKFKPFEVEYGNGEIKIDSLIYIDKKDIHIVYYCHNNKLTLYELDISLINEKYGMFYIGMDISELNKIFPEIKCKVCNVLVMKDMSEMLEVELRFKDYKLINIKILNNS